MTAIPPMPMPRTDNLPADLDESEQEVYLELLMDSATRWRDQDGTLYMLNIPPSMQPPVGGQARGPIALSPDHAEYKRWLAQVPPEYDFMEPTPVAPVPRETAKQPQEAADAQAPDDDTA